MGATMKNWAKLGLCGAMAMSSSIAMAETLPVTGMYPAQVDLPGDLDVIAIDPFGGDAGADLEIALTDVLGNINIDGQPWFRIAPPLGYGQSGTVYMEGTEGDPVTLEDPNSPDALLRGSVRSEVLERRLDPKIVEECVERDEDRKCIRTEERRIPCLEMSVRIDPRVSLTSMDGRQLYAFNTPQSQTASYCRNDATIPSALDMGNRLIDQLAAAVRYDLAPVRRSDGYRIMERRKGLKGADRNAFKDAIKLTKTDQGAACAKFQDMMQVYADHVSVVFNVGLCAESYGYLDSAEELYRQTLSIDPKNDYASDGLRRLRDRRRAEFQLEAREQSDPEA
jgi:hypothetical protein